MFRFYFMLFTALSFWTCKFTEKKTVIAPAGFDWQGHRGSRGLRPENTIPAFVEALRYPQVTTLELDLVVSKDKQLIVSHEPWFNEQICKKMNGDSIGKSNIYTMKAAEIVGFDCGSWGNTRFPNQQKMVVTKPLFTDLVKAIQTQYPDRAKAIQWNIEIKSAPDWDNIFQPPVEEFAALVIQSIRDLGLTKQCNVQSFDKRILQAMHRQAIDIKLALLIDEPKTVSEHLALLGFQPDCYSPYYLTVSKKMVKFCHQKGMKIIPWTVNDVPSMRRLIRLGVDGIITDYPNLITGI